MTKSKHVHLLVEPSIHNLAIEMAQQLGVSVAEVYRRGIILLAKEQKK